MNISPRSLWIRALTVHPTQTLQIMVENLAQNWQVNYQLIPQSGLSLLQLQDGVFHEPYYLGEIPLAKAQIEIVNERGESFIGAALVMNDSVDLAVALAVCDAVMAHQLSGWQQVAELIEQGIEKRALEDLHRGAMLAKTKVNFALLNQGKMMLKIDTIWQGETQQKIFRHLLHCMSLPGEIINLSQDLGKTSALVGVLATLLDESVTWSDEDELVNERDRSLLQGFLVPSQTAQFIIKNASHSPQNNFLPHLGELSNPEKGATLILQGKVLGIGNTSLELTGCGIQRTKIVSCQDFHPQWFVKRHQWNQNFPLGVDLILVDSSQIMALPRTTQIKY